MIADAFDPKQLWKKDAPTHEQSTAFQHCYIWTCSLNFNILYIVCIVCWAHSESLQTNYMSTYLSENTNAFQPVYQAIFREHLLYYHVI